jgi:DNA polymerase III sliding clamp (beta) subunit (PCNA family)
MKIERELLLNALNSVKSAISSSPRLPVIEGILMVSDGIYLELTGTNLAESCTCKIHHGSADEVFSVVATSLLYKTVSLIEEEFIEIKAIKDELILSSSYGKFNSPLMISTDFPKMNTSGTPIVIKIEKGLEFIKEVNNASAFVSDNEFTGMYGVNVDFENNIVSICGTNAKYLYLNKEFTCDYNENKSFTLTKESIKLVSTLKELLSSDNELIIELYENNVVFKTNDTKSSNVVQCSLLEYKYPAYKPFCNVYPDSHWITIDDLRINTLLKSLILYSSAETNSVFVRNESELIYFTSGDNGIGTSAKIDITASESTQDLAVTLNINNLVKILNLVKGNAVFHAISKDKGIFIKDSTRPNLLYLIQPQIY